MGPGQLQKLGHVLRQIHRIARPGDEAVVAAPRLEVLVEHLGVGPLLVGGVEKHGLNEVQALLSGGGGGEGVAVAGLALPGEGPQQVLPGDAVFPFHGPSPPFLIRPP